MPPLREAECCVDLATGATHISKATYWTAPTELNDLKTQLIAIRKGLYPAQHVPMGGPDVVHEKEVWNPRIVHRL